MLPRVLISNDDGITASGLRALVDVFASVAEVWVVAPDRERSAASHSISLHEPLRIKQLDKREFMVDGTPTDCVYVAVNHLLPEPPDLVVSGINAGANLGTDVMYSGTVAAAMEGAIFGVRAMAVSLAISDNHKGRGEVLYKHAAQVAFDLGQSILSGPVRHGVVYNVNVPDLPRAAWQGVKLCRLGYTNWADAVDERVDPRGRRYFWIGGERTGHDSIDDSDNNALGDGHVTVTPIHYDLTDYRSFAGAREMMQALQGHAIVADGLGDSQPEHPVLPQSGGRRQIV